MLSKQKRQKSEKLNLIKYLYSITEISKCSQPAAVLWPANREVLRHFQFHSWKGERYRKFRTQGLWKTVQSHRANIGKVP